jgi:short-subunit dehydrogenase
MRPHSIIIGASAGLGRAIAEELAARAHRLYLISSDIEDLHPLAQDLRIRYNAEVFISSVELKNFSVHELYADVCNQIGEVNNLFLIAGKSDPLQDSGFIDDHFLNDLITTNFLSICQIVNIFLPVLSKNRSHNLVGIGSVAGVRGRQKNMVYAASKRGLETYFESCRHWLAHQNGAKVQFYRLGIMNTSMAQSGGPFPMADPRKIARTIANNLGKDLGTTPLPNWWKLIMLIIQNLPWFIFKKLNI